MDILIKSFNRPYYLDRCIQSIHLYCKNGDYKIKVLDDGTPQKYLDKLLRKYPEISIYKSKNYREKEVCCALGVKPENMEVPINLWIEAAKESTDIFFLLEDDIWLTEDLDLDFLNKSMLEDRVKFLKLFWLGNPKLIRSKSVIKKEFYSVFEPDLYTTKPFLYLFVFYKFNRFKIRKILKFLKVNTFEKALSYYSIYSVAGVIFSKDYFIDLWKNHTSTVEEGLQLYNAVRYYNSNKRNIAYAHSNNEVLKTGFMSSATNQFKDYKDVNVDMFAFNKIINEAWYNEEFDSMDHFSKDLNSEEIEGLLSKANNSLATKEEWKKWTGLFKKQFTSFGCKID
jgi:hypothetical protein